MGVIPGSPRFDVVVSPTRIKHDTRVFKNVVAADPTGMSYNPADYDLQVVHEPHVGYRCIALDAVIRVWPAARSKDGRFLAQKKLRNSNLTNLSFLRGR